jgi:hypothetical protein
LKAQQVVYGTIKNVVGQANILTIPRVFIDFLGDLETALFLSQVIYWSDRGKQFGGWFYKTYQEWEQELGLNEYKVRKAKTKLENLGILQTKIKKADGNPTVHYKLLAKPFDDWFLQNLKERSCENLRNETINF